jgi:hypothetical protein
MGAFSESDMHESTRSDLQRVRELTSELYALTVEVSGFTQDLRRNQRAGAPLGPMEALRADTMLAQITRTATLLWQEAQRLQLEPERVA